MKYRLYYIVHIIWTRLHGLYFYRFRHKNMFRQRGEEYVDPSKAKIEEAIQRKIRDQAERHYRNRETQKGNGSIYFYHTKVCFLCMF